MIIGHYATALVPYSLLHRRIPLWPLLLVANLADFLWIALGLLGLEAPIPASLWQATFETISVDMPYSHDLLPTAGLGVAVMGIACAVSRDRQTALWCGALVVAHFLFDLLSGFEHHIAGPRSPSVGLALYTRAPHLALAVEAIAGAACVAWYIHHERKEGRPLSRRRCLALYALFIGGALVWLPTATIPLAQFFGS